MTTLTALTSVYCAFGLCPFLLRKGHPQLVGRISGRAELRCPSCKQIQVFEV